MLRVLCPRLRVEAVNRADKGEEVAGKGGDLNVNVIRGTAARQNRSGQKSSNQTNLTLSPEPLNPKAQTLESFPLKPDLQM